MKNVILRGTVRALPGFIRHHDAMRKHGPSSTASATATTAALLTLLMSFAAVARAQDYTADFETSLSADGWSTGYYGNSWNRIYGPDGTTSGIGATVAASGNYYA